MARSTYRRLDGSVTRLRPDGSPEDGKPCGIAWQPPVHVTAEAPTAVFRVDESHDVLSDGVVRGTLTIAPPARVHSVSFAFPIRLKSPNMVRGNTKLAAIIRHQEKSRERAAGRLHTIAAIRQARLTADRLLPCSVTLTRLGPRKCDDDNLAAMCKAVRDGIADALGIDDGGRFVQWHYAQDVGRRGFYGLRITIARIAQT